MSLEPADNEQVRLADAEHTQLEALLKRKLSGIPAYNLPALTLADILHKTPRALHLPQIPSDIQLAFFLRNRALIDQHSSKPIKDEDRQSPGITRAIWYYRLDSAHQFQRYHDTARWNIALFTALLSLTPGAPPNMPRSRTDTYVPPAGQRFMTQYLAAVLEHHNTPTIFTARERFIELWKGGVYDVFEVHGSGQKKLLKNELKRLTREWEDELDIAMRQMDRAEYDARVAIFVGSLVPGRKDQGLLPPTLNSNPTPVTPPVSTDGEGKNETEKDIEKEGVGPAEGGEPVENELLAALRVPLGEHVKEGVQNSMGRGEVTTVTDIRMAIATLQNGRPRDMLHELMRLFPPKSG